MENAINYAKIVVTNFLLEICLLFRSFVVRESTTQNLFEVAEQQIVYWFLFVKKK